MVFYVEPCANCERLQSIIKAGGGALSRCAGYAGVLHLVADDPPLVAAAAAGAAVAGARRGTPVPPPSPRVGGEGAAAAATGTAVTARFVEACAEVRRLLPWRRFLASAAGPSLHPSPPRGEVEEAVAEEAAASAASPRRRYNHKRPEEGVGQDGPHRRRLPAAAPPGEDGKDRGGRDEGLLHGDGVSGRRLPFTAEEDAAMRCWVATHPQLGQQGQRLWKDAERAQVTRHGWISMQNHWRRKLRGRLRTSLPRRSSRILGCPGATAAGVHPLADAETLPREAVDSGNGAERSDASVSRRAKRRLWRSIALSSVRGCVGGDGSRRRWRSTPAGAGGGGGGGGSGAQPRVVAAAAAKELPCHPFTPAVISGSQCLARVWRGGLGGQCMSPPVTGGAGLCSIHAKQDCLAHGRVDGPVPVQVLKKFLRVQRRGGDGGGRGGGGGGGGGGRGGGRAVPTPAPAAGGGSREAAGDGGSAGETLATAMTPPPSAATRPAADVLSVTAAVLPAAAAHPTPAALPAAFAGRPAMEGAALNTCGERLKRRRRAPTAVDMIAPKSGTDGATPTSGTSLGPRASAWAPVADGELPLPLSPTLRPKTEEPSSGSRPAGASVVAAVEAPRLLQVRRRGAEAKPPKAARAAAAAPPEPPPLKRAAGAAVHATAVTAGTQILKRRRRRGEEKERPEKEQEEGEDKLSLKLLCRSNHDWVLATQCPSLLVDEREL